MMEWVAVIAVTIILAAVAGLLTFFGSTWVFDRTFRASREKSFRRHLQSKGYTEREIGRAVEEQGW